jgi:uncharacterized protein YaeQ
LALKSTVYKFALNVADMDRQVYGDFPLTLARHPSETESRLMLRLLAFALHAASDLEFGRGISTDDEPDLWRRDPTGRVTLWIDLGTPDPERLRKACSRADSVALYCYGDRATPVWWEKHSAALARFDRLRVLQIADTACNALAGLARHGAQLQCSIAGGEVWLASESDHFHVVPLLLKP